MTKNKTSIKVPEDVAEAYRNASPERRKRAERAMAAALEEDTERGILKRAKRVPEKR